MPAQPRAKARLRPANHGPRVRREKRTIAAMLGIYCRAHHQPQDRASGHWAIFHSARKAPAPSRAPESIDSAVAASGERTTSAEPRAAATKGLCPDCAELLHYAHQRLDNCVFGELKHPCSHCTVHCYSKTLRPKVIAVMRYAGPRLLLRHPLLALWHMLDKRRRS